MISFDLIVIGGGSGGVACARRAAAHGARVALIERDRLGGTCVIRGCVPKKLMMYASRLSGEWGESHAWGWTAQPPRFDMAAWQSAKRIEIDRLEAVYRDLLSNSGVAWYVGHAQLTGPGLVTIGDQLLASSRIVLATGSRPNRAGIDGLHAAMTSDDVLDLQYLPRRIAIVGGGFIAMEFASILRGFGADVAVFFRANLPLRGFDLSLRQHCAAALAQRGIALHEKADLVRVDAHGVQTSIQHHDFDAVINATGRLPNSTDLGLDTAGVAVDASGAVVVDEFSQSSLPGVFAVGDVTNRKNLTPVAIAEGRALADNEFSGTRRRVDHSSVASAVFTSPPIGTIGMSEEDALKRGRLRVYETQFRPMKTAFAGGQTRTYMKLVVDDDNDRVLGIHMMGDDAPEIVQSLAVAYTMGATKADFDRTMAVHPTSAEEFVLMREPVRRG